VYSAEISRANPTCFVLMIDQSASMQDPLGGGSGRRKCEEVADAVNRLLSELAIKCAKEEGVGTTSTSLSSATGAAAGRLACTGS
jgi:hypothetical protein